MPETNKPSTTQTHIVLKISDCQKYLNSNELQELASILRKVGIGRKANGKQIGEYIIVNLDEPYSERIFRQVLVEESKKRSQQ